MLIRSKTVWIVFLTPGTAGFYQPPEIEMKAVEMEPLQREIAENPVDAAKGGMSH